MIEVDGLAKHDRVHERSPGVRSPRRVPRFAAGAVAVYDLANGRSEGRRRFAERPVLSRVDDELVVGTAHAIERLRLPTLDLLAQVKLPTGQAPRDLAASRSAWPTGW